MKKGAVASRLPPASLNLELWPPSCDIDSVRIESPSPGAWPMTPTHLDLNALADKIEVLEKRNRQLRNMLLLLSALVVGAGSLAFVAPQSDPIKTSRLVLTDAVGVQRGEVTATPSTLSFRLLDPASGGSTASSALSLSRDGISVIDARGDVLGWLGRARARTITE